MLQRRIAVLAAIAFTTLSANDAHAAELRLIDAHSQFDRDVEPEWKYS